MACFFFPIADLKNSSGCNVIQRIKKMYGRMSVGSVFCKEMILFVPETFATNALHIYVHQLLEVQPTIVSDVNVF